MFTELNDVYKQRIHNWKRASILFMSTTIALIVALYVFSGDFRETAKTTVKQVEIIEQLRAENALLEERVFTDSLIMMLDMSTADEWSIHKRSGEGYTLLLTKGDISVWATEENLQETIYWLNSIPKIEE